MKKLLRFVNIQLVLSVGGWLLTSTTTAQDLQDVIYFETGDVAQVRLKNVTEEKIIVQASNSSNEKTFSRSRIVIAFSKEGNFLVISELSPNIAQAKEQLQAFLTAPPRIDKTDFLIKAKPLSVIPASISFENDKIVNYRTPEGNAASISKNDLIAILYKDRRHLLIQPAAEVAPLLAEVRPDLANGGKPITPPAAPQSNTSTALSTDSSATTPSITEGDMGNKRTLSEEEKELYRQKSFARVNAFLNYIEILTDKRRSSEDKDQAIIQAERLFVEGSKTKIEVNSKNRPIPRQMSLHQYLTQLKLLPYKSTKVEWYDAQFVQDLTLMADGTYEGTIAGEQRFTGFGSGGQTMYSDITKKNVRVKLSSYQKIIDGDAKIRWQTLLGNIKVNNDEN